MKSLWKDWREIKKKIGLAKKILLLLDFDGTLAPIAKTPGAVVLKKETKRAVERLGRLPKYRVAIISGRSLKDVRSFFRLKKIFYVGNHGLEIRGWGVKSPGPARRAKKLAALVWLVGEKLKASFRRFPGVWVEDKGYTLSLHFRNLPAKDSPSFKKKFSDFKAHNKKYPLVWRKGKKVWELRPRVEWGKGHAALYLSKKFLNALPIVVGDDVTDEDMFKALERRGITVRVGYSKHSAADHFLRSPKEVTKFLEKLSR